MLENQNSVEISLTIDYRLTELRVERGDRDVLWQTATSTAGCELVWAVIQHLQTQHNLLIGKLTAEHLILSIGDALLPAAPSLTMMARGRNLRTGHPDALELTDVDISLCIASTIDQVVSMVYGSVRPHDVSFSLPQESEQLQYPVNWLPQEFRKQLENGHVVLKGIFGKIKGLDQRLREETGFMFAYE